MFKIVLSTFQNHNTKMFENFFEIFLNYLFKENHCLKVFSKHISNAFEIS